VINGGDARSGVIEQNLAIFFALFFAALSLAVTTLFAEKA